MPQSLRRRHQRQRRTAEFGRRHAQLLRRADLQRRDDRQRRHAGSEQHAGQPHRDGQFTGGAGRAPARSTTSRSTPAARSRPAVGLSGTLTAGAVTLNSSAAINVSISGPTVNDLLSAAANLTLGGGNLQLNVTPASPPPAPSTRSCSPPRRQHHGHGHLVRRRLHAAGRRQHVGKLAGHLGRRGRPELAERRQLEPGQRRGWAGERQAATACNCSTSAAPSPPVSNSDVLIQPSGGAPWSARRRSTPINSLTLGDGGSHLTSLQVAGGNLNVATLTSISSNGLLTVGPASSYAGTFTTDSLLVGGHGERRQRRDLDRQHRGQHQRHGNRSTSPGPAALFNAGSLDIETERQHDRQHHRRGGYGQHRERDRSTWAGWT